MKKRRRWIRGLLLAGAAVFVLAAAVAEVLHISTHNTWYAWISLLLIFGCLCAAGLLYSCEIREKKPVLCYFIRFGTLFIGVILLVCVLTLLKGG